MAEAYGISSTSMNAVARKIAAMRAAGITVQPWQEQAFYEAEMNALEGKRTANRGLSQQADQFAVTSAAQAARDAEAIRMNDENARLREEERKSAEKGQTTGALTQAGTTGLMLNYMMKDPNTGTTPIGEGYRYVKDLFTPKTAPVNPTPPVNVTPPVANPMEGAAPPPEFAPPTETAKAVEAGTAGGAAEGGAAHFGSMEAGSNVGDFEVAGNAMEGAAPGAGAGGGATFGKAVPIAGYVAAADIVRQKYGELDKPYDERNSRAKFKSAPVTGGAPALMTAAGLSDSNVFNKFFSGPAKAEDETVGKSLDEAFAGNFDKSASAFWEGLKNSPSRLKESVGCGIIMTAIHGADSPEVDLCRKYRDRFLTDEQLRGYYVFAEPACFIMGKHPKLKKYFKKYLTDSFVDYAGYRLNEKASKPSLRSVIISRAFLRLCSILGRKVPMYTRLNGEEV